MTTVWCYYTGASQYSDPVTDRMAGRSIMYLDLLAIIMYLDLLAIIIYLDLLAISSANSDQMAPIPTEGDELRWTRWLGDSRFSWR
jgi:hypothetical protein